MKQSSNFQFLGSLTIRALILSTIAVIIFLSWLYRSAYYASHLPVESVIGTPLPQGIREAQAYQGAKGSVYVQLFFPEEEAKLSLLIAPNDPNNLSKSLIEPEKMFAAVRLFKTTKSVTSGFSQSVLTFLAAQGDTRRGRDVSFFILPSLANFQGIGASFSGKNEDKHVIGTLRLLNFNTTPLQEKFPHGGEIGFAFFTQKKSLPQQKVEELLKRLAIFN